MQGQLTKYRGSCHCGAVAFEVQTTLAPALRCNCSLCRRKGAVMAPVATEHFQLLKGEDDIVLYQFNTQLAKHYFCKHCGIYTFHRPRVAPDTYRVNVGCLEGVDVSNLEIKMNDGAAYSTVDENTG
jgi:hypothetical protein